jgi:hypothetical protein
MMASSTSASAIALTSYLSIDRILSAISMFCLGEFFANRPMLYAAPI